MDRRKFIGGLVTVASAAGVSSLLPSCRAASAQADRTPPGAVDVVEAFGFVADGRTDNYAAFGRWAAHVNRARGGTYVFPPGTYLVRQHRTRSLALRDPRSVINSLIADCQDLTVVGYDATIRLSGHFHRSARIGPGGEALGRHMAIFMPFELHRCRRVRIAGFEMDGGLREMSRDESVTEAYAALIALHGCSEVSLEDLDLHHCQTDAVYLAASTPPGRRQGLTCRDIRLRNVNCHRNARGGMGIIQVFGLTCTDCSFSHNGELGGRYLPHAPRFGVTVEPDYGSPADIDQKTGNLEFRRCAFEANGTAFAAAYGDRCEGYLRLIDCRSSNGGGSPYHIMISWAGALVEGGVHDAGEGTFWTSWHGQTGGDLIVRGCEIRTSGLYGLFHPFAGNRVRIEEVRLVGTHRGPGSHGWVLAVQGDPGGGRKNVVRNCDIFIPAARKSADHLYDYEVSFHHTLSESNRFRTDLPAARGQHFCTDYSTGAVVRGDRYRGSAPGTQDSFRPSHNATHDTRQPYSRG